MRNFCWLLLLLILGCESREPAMAARPDSELPVVTLRFIVAEQSHEAFLAELRSFADVNGFAMRVGNPGPATKDVTVQMWREDLKLIGVNPFEPGEFRVSFYYNDNEHVPVQFVEELAVRLKEGVVSVPGVTLDEGGPDDP